MEHHNDTFEILELMAHPAFCVKDGIIVKTNSAAAGYGLAEGSPVVDILETGREDYRAYRGGCLYLTLSLSGLSLGASVNRMEDWDIFCIEQDADNRELQAMALASRELRKPLSSVMTTAQKLFPLSREDDPITEQQITRLNRGLFQILRVIENMSDANRYATAGTAGQELRDLGGLIQEIFDKAAGLVSHTGLTMTYEGIAESVFSLADSEKLERAIFNILSNAVKFTPSGGRIDAKLTRRDQFLYLTVTDTGSGIMEELRGNIFSRYTRQPSLEDGRFGIGLGMVLIRSTAALHGGTVLVDQNPDGGTRLIMSLAIRPGKGDSLHSPRHHIDYSGGWDPGLIALAESLPPELYLPHSDR